jgi:hypothetical protein
MDIFARFGLVAKRRDLSAVELETFVEKVSKMMTNQTTPAATVKFGEFAGKRDSPLIPADLARHV